MYDLKLCDWVAQGFRFLPACRRLGAWQMWFSLPAAGRCIRSGVGVFVLIVSGVWFEASRLGSIIPQSPRCLLGLSVCSLERFNWWATLHHSSITSLSSSVCESGNSLGEWSVLFGKWIQFFERKNDSSSCPIGPTLILFNNRKRNSIQFLHFLTKTS